MLNNQGSRRALRLTLLISFAGAAAGIVAGFAAGAQPFYLGVALFAVAVLIYFFAKFEQAVLALLILRSSLDIFSGIQLPAAFAIGVDILTLLYVVVMLLTGQHVRTDKFWWLFASWMMLQSLWIVLLLLGALGMDASFLPNAIRDWLRYFSWVIIYLLVMQLKDRIHPEKLISTLLLALVAPITVALMQIFLPASILPALLTAQGKAGSNVSGTLGFPNGLGIFLSMFIALVWWKVSISKQRLPWLLLLGLISFIFVSTGYFTGLIAVFILILCINADKITPVRLIGAAIFCFIILSLFGTTEFGQQRLTEIYQTPLLNPDIDVSRAIILSYGDSNSFNWRITHWYYLLQSWTKFPILGYGLGTSAELGIRNLQTGGGYAAHNDYIRVLVEQGIVGLVIFVLFLLVQGLHLVRLLQRSPEKSSQRSLCLILIALLISNSVSMLSNNIMDATTFFVYWWVLVAIAGWEKEKWQVSKSTV